MGINTNVYTIYGIRLPWSDEFNNANTAIEEQLADEFGYGKPYPDDRQISAIFDELTGDYIILGKILYDSGDFRYCEDMNDYTEIDVSSLENYKKEYLAKFHALYPDFASLVEGKEWKLINIIHYS